MHMFGRKHTAENIGVLNKIDDLNNYGKTGGTTMKKLIMGLFGITLALSMNKPALYFQFFCQFLIDIHIIFLTSVIIFSLALMKIE